MSRLVFDGRTGASGDMLLAALVAVGADPAVLAPVEDALDVTYDVTTVDRNGIAATEVTVQYTDADSTDDAVGHSHDHDHEAEHSHDHTHDHIEGHGPHRSYDEVRSVLAALDIPDRVAADAASVFELLGEAEASVHGVDLSEMHFHEVGADDAIADVVGVSLLIDDLDPDAVLTTPVALGGGEVTMSHGRYPVPPPAVAEILGRADFETYGGPVDTELLTPTGAALLAHFASGVDRLPPMQVDATGYGAGGKSLGDRPNVLRAVVGDSTDAGPLTRDEVVLLETNVDDVEPEILGSLHETLADVGARDVSIVPLTMKKSRPGHLIKVIARDEDADRVARKLAAETGTLGIRETGLRHRWIADREFEEVLLEYDGHTYEVIVKIARDGDDNIYDVSAEYDDALAVATATGVPVRRVCRDAENAVER